MITPQYFTDKGFDVYHHNDDEDFTCEKSIPNLVCCEIRYFPSCNGITIDVYKSNYPKSDCLVKIPNMVVSTTEQLDFLFDSISWLKHITSNQ